MTTVDQLEIRPVTSGEFLAWARAVMTHFHEDESDDHLEMWRPVTELDRTLAAFDHDRIVANLGVISFTCSVPYARPVACAGLTAVGVAMTHRRRGLLRRMMQLHLQDAAARGEPLAALFASESPIYGRFGYGIAAPSVALRVERQWSQLDVPGDVSLVEQIEAKEAIEVLPAVYEQARGQRPGMMSRDAARWRFWLGNDPDSWRDGASRRRILWVPGRGYAVFRLKERWADGGPSGSVKVIEHVATDVEAAAALWQLLFDIDLMTRVEAELRPPDDPLLVMLTNPARTRLSAWDGLYVRLVDVAGALMARGYATSGRVVIEVVRDDLLPANARRYLLVAGPGGATCEPTEQEPDLRLPVEALSAVYLGGVRATQLAAARRLEECRPGAAAAADRLFAADVLPWNPFMF